MPIKIITADERLRAAPKINIALFAEPKVGKTFQARTLDPKSTLFVDLEAGVLAIQGWTGDVVDVRSEATRLGVHPWDFCRALVCWLGGPDPAAPADSPYGASAYAGYVAALGDPADFAGKTTIFWDSITEAARHCFAWCQTQPDAFSEKTGKPDTRGAYGLHGREMVRWLKQIQHIPGRSTVVVCILNRHEDDLKRVSWVPQIDGSKTVNELPGIFDELVTMAFIDNTEGQKFRAFVCHKDNQWGYPAGDRSGRLDLLEPPDLGALMAKIHGGKRMDGEIARTLPAPPPPAPLATADAPAAAA